MKKVITLVITVAMLLSLAVTVSAADSSVASYDSANYGDLLYAVNFKGEDGVFEPQAFGEAANNVDYTVSEDGKELHIDAKVDKKYNYYGGVITGLVANEETTYTMIYKVRANGTAGKDNSVGIGGIIVNGVADETGKFYSNYGNHNTTGEGGTITDRRSALSLGSGKLESEYAMFNKLADYDEDAEGFVTMRIDFVGKKIVSYILKDGAEYSSTNFDSWIKIEENEMELDDTDDAVGFMVYSWYEVVDTTIKNVEIYKGPSFDHYTTTAKTTKAPIVITTTAKATAAPTAATTAADEGGCGGTLTFAAAALIPALGAGVVLAKKRKFD